ncbi:MAG: CcmD family protein [Ignavibacteriae bacterium]|nr:CcmD family protein [Ignavibacteriota bacterium]
MVDFFSSNQMYIVLGVVLLIWVGIVGYLFRLERKLTELEKNMKRGEEK